MITLREPIQLKNKTVTSIGDSFGERIRENYHQISISLEPEDLLHIVTQPAEVFYAEGNQTSIFNRNIKVETVNENKLNVVNQLINRILVSGQANFTYQDRVFVSNILRKLGITDEKRFMHYVTQMMSESKSQTKELRELTNRVDTLRERIPEVMESIKKHSEDKKEENQAADTRLYLAESIYNRLQTNRVYDTVWNFNRNSKDETNITHKELSISEQKKSSTHIKLNQLAMTIVGSPVEMVHSQTNVLEEPQIENILQLSEEVVRNQLVESSLYNLIRQVYEARNTQIDQGTTTNFNVTQAMFETAENTFTRYVENIVTPIVERSSIERENKPAVRQVLNYLEQQTLDAQTQEFVTNEINQINEQNVEKVNQYFNTIRELREKSSHTLKPDEKGSVMQTDSPDTYQILNHVEQQNITENNEEIIANRLEHINQQNIENRNHYLRVMQQLKERTTHREISPTRTIKESLDALDNPAPLLLQYKEEQEQAISEELAKRDMVIEAYPEKVRPLLKYIDNIMTGQSSGQIQGFESEDALSVLNADIAQIEMQHREDKAPTIVEKGIDNTVYVEQLVEHIKKSPKGQALRENVEHISQINRNLQLVHKITETINEEEILERIDELRNETREAKTVQTTESSDVVTTVNRVTNEEHVVNETINETELTELVRQHVISQMGDLSEQVYAKIEKKLQNEKIRRGF